MITVSTTTSGELKVTKDKAHSLSTVINKRKNNLITNFVIKKKPKKKRLNYKKFWIFLKN